MKPASETPATCAVPIEAWHDLLLAGTPKLRAYARLLCGSRSAADDLVQDTLLKALRNRERFQAGTNLSAWLTAVMRNHFITGLRRRREVPDPDGAHTEAMDCLPDQLDRLALKDLQAALQRLPMEQREALLLVAVQGYTYNEAADLCGVVVGTIKSRVCRAKTALEQALELKSRVNNRGRCRPTKDRGSQPPLLFQPAG